jgi:hypothetical protein
MIRQLLICFFTAKRKNMWICALKGALKECQIYGPSGNPSAPPGIQHVTMVPYEPPTPAPHVAPSSMPEPLIPRGDFNLADKNAVIADDSLDVYDERDELHMTNPRPTMPRPRVGGPPMPEMTHPRGMPGTSIVPTPHQQDGSDYIEMDTRAGGQGPSQYRA